MPKSTCPDSTRRPSRLARPGEHHDPLSPAMAAGEAGPTAPRSRRPRADSGIFLGVRDGPAGMARLSRSGAARAHLAPSLRHSRVPPASPAAPLRAVPRPRPSFPTSGCRSAPSVLPSPITRQRADLIRVKLLAHFVFRRQPLCGQARDSQTALPTSLHSQVEAPTTTTLALLPGSASCAHGPVRAAAPPGNNVSCGSHVPPPVRTDRAEQLRYTPRGPKDGNTSFWSFTDKAC